MSVFEFCRKKKVKQEGKLLAKWFIFPFFVSKFSAFSTMLLLPVTELTVWHRVLSRITGTSPSTLAAGLQL